MNLNFVTKKPEEDDPITAKIKETIDFQKDYENEEYRSPNGKDYDLGFIAGLEHTLEIIKKIPPIFTEKIVYKEVPTSTIMVQRIVQKRYVPIEGEDILRKMIKLCAEYNEILSDEVVKLHFGIDMNDIRRDLFENK